MITKKRLFKPTHKQPNGLVLAYVCELTVVPDSTATARLDSLAAARLDSLAAARWDSICAADRIESDPAIDPTQGVFNLVRKGVKKALSSAAQNIAKSEAVERLKEWWNDEDEEDD